jgi:transposase
LEVIYIGIDWGSRVHTVCILDRDGQRLLEQEVSHDGAMIRKFVEQAVELVEGDASRIVAGMEAPRGTMVEALLDRGAQVFSISPRQLERFRDRYSPAGAKDDDLDAYVLADTLRSDRKFYRRVQLLEPELIRLRELSRTYDNLTEQAKALGNQVADQLNRYYPQLLRLSDGWHETAWLWTLFDKAPTPQLASSLRQSVVEKVLKGHRVRRYKPADVLQELRKESLHVAPGVADSAAEQIATLLPILRVVHQQRSACSKQMARLLEQASQPESDDPEGSHRDAALLLSLPGIGIHNGAAMLAEASTALRERDYQSLRKLCGAAPVSKRTGGRDKRPLVNQRRACNPRLREATYHWARIATQCDARTRAHYAALRSKGHSHGRALRGVADRLLKLLVSMLASGQLYDPTRRAIPIASAAR